MYYVSAFTSPEMLEVSETFDSEISEVLIQLTPKDNKQNNKITKKSNIPITIQKTFLLIAPDEFVVELEEDVEDVEDEEY